MSDPLIHQGTDKIVSWIDRYVTKKGTPAIGATARYMQVSQERVKEKLKHIRG